MPGQALCAEDREEIRAGIERGESFAQIGRSLSRPTSTISREVQRNHGRGAYNATRAEKWARLRRRRKRLTRFERDPSLGGRVAESLKSKDSPMTISRELAREGTALSHETIYQAVYAKGLRGLERGLHVHLHRGRRKRRPRRRRSAELGYRSPLGNFSPIALRPEIAWARTEIGHFEGDLILGRRNGSAVVTLVDRASRLNLLGWLPEGHDAGEVLARLVAMFHRVPPRLRRTLTWDQGYEMARWKTLEELVEIPVYFCEPHHPWQRPTNEAFNGLVRRWLPKGTDLSLHDQDQLDAISRQINDMPRRSLGWESASECYGRLALQ